MSFTITCQCGYTDTIDNMITATKPRKEIKIIDRQEVTGYIYDRIFSCPNCGFTEEKTVSLGAGFKVVDEESGNN